jgi:hypothetical protein
MVKRKSSRVVAVATRQPAKKKPARKLTIAPRPVAISGPPAVSLYSVHPGVAMMQKWIAELKPKTGCSLEEWIAHIRVRGPKDLGECRQWLQEKHRLGTNSASWLAEKALGDRLGMADDSPESYLAACPGYVDQMYAGGKRTLRPLHDELVRLVRLLGEDVRVCPCQTIVPLYRRHVFAQIKPASSKRIDLGLALEDEPFTARLLDTGGRAKKARLTHCVAITSLADIDLQVKRWLKQAYERDA